MRRCCRRPSSLADSSHITVPSPSTELSRLPLCAFCVFPSHSPSPNPTCEPIRCTGGSRTCTTACSCSRHTRTASLRKNLPPEPGYHNNATMTSIKHTTVPLSWPVSLFRRCDGGVSRWETYIFSLCIAKWWSHLSVNCGRWPPILIHPCQRRTATMSYMSSDYAETSTASSRVPSTSLLQRQRPIPKVLLLVAVPQRRTT